MSDIDNTINTLRDQVEALQYDLEQATEANKEWHELMNDNTVSDINELVEFARDYDFDAVKSFMNDFDFDEVVSFLNTHDLNELESALKYNGIDELERAYNKIDEYGDPEEMAEKLERLEEEVQDITATDRDGLVAREDYESEVKIRQDTQTMLNETQNKLDEVAQRMRESDVYIVSLKTQVARLQADYDQLLEYNTRICRECDALRAAEPGVYTQSKEKLLLEILDLTTRYNTLRDLYFAEVSGFDDVPSSKPRD